MQKSSGTSTARVTIYDVAEQAGVGIATVSRVLNGSKPVSEKVTTQVRTVVEKLGYVPNRTAKTLAERDRFVLAVAVPSFVTPFYTGVLSGIRHVLKGFEVEMLLKDLGAQAPLAELGRFLNQGGVDGLLIISAHPDAATTRRLNNWPAPVVLVGAQADGLDAFYWNEVAGGRMATCHLIEQGHRCIGLIRASLSIRAQASRLQGYRAALEDNGLPFDESLVCSGETEAHAGFSEEAGYEAMQQLLARGRAEMKGVVCSSDVQAVGAWKAIRDAGLSVPDDIALVGYNDVKTSRFIGLSSVSQQMSQAGKRATRRLLRRMGSGSATAERVQVRIQLTMQARRSSGAL